MSPFTLLSVNVAQPRALGAKSDNTGIFKCPVSGPVEVRALGLAADHVLNTKHHGGPDQAVYVYTQPDYEYWAPSLGALQAGTFGENLLISALESAALPIGERLQLGEVVLEITAARIPCATLAARMNDPKFAKTFRAARRPGFYARVVQPGHLQAQAEGRLLGTAKPGAPTVLDTFELFYNKAPTLALVEWMLDAPVAERNRHQLTALRRKLLSKAPSSA